MSDNNVECVHMDPETQPDMPVKNKKERWIYLAGGALVCLVAVGISLWLFLPRRTAEPEVPTTTQAAQSGAVVVGGESDPYTDDSQTEQPVSSTEDNPLLAQAIVFYDSGDYTNAIETLNQAVQLFPDSGAIYSYRGFSYFQLGNYREAVADLTQAIIRMGDSAELFTLRGAAYYQQSMYPEAIGDLTQAIKLDPNSTNAYTYRAMAYDATGRVELAAADREKLNTGGNVAVLG